MPGPPSTRGERGSPVERQFDADERAKLQVLKSATEPTAPLYAEILSVLVAAKERYQVQVRTEDVAAALTGHGFDTSTLTAAMEQLKDWGGTSGRTLTRSLPPSTPVTPPPVGSENSARLVTRRDTR